ncbi:MAG: hypothetical protein WBD28_08785 [Candidatus Zixiibacteriota bacterium]
MKQIDVKKRIRKLLLRAREISREKGIYSVVRSGVKITVNWLVNYLCYCYYRKIKWAEIFTFQGKTYRYFYHRYNHTWKNERAVEIPIIWAYLKKYHARRTLEVGNVLSHYFRVNHDIIDKYEKADGVINKDIVDFKPLKKYDLIVSISTLEHVGWDENPREPVKILHAIENFKNLLSPGGTAIATVPLGYNSEMDELLKERKTKFTKQYYLKRITKNNKWIEAGWDDVCDAKYGEPFPNASALVIGIIVRK